MDWQDEGIVLASRRHGEGDAILSALTREHGRHLGLVKGGTSRRQRPVLEIGNRLNVTWRARLSEQLGNFQVEQSSAVSAGLLDDPLRLAGLAASCAVTDLALPEREPHAEVFADLAALIDFIIGADDDWPAAYVRWELALLADLGFGLDLGHCAVTGETEGLAFVSPKTGRAVTAAAGRPYADRLLVLPPFLTDTKVAAERPDLLAGLRLTGHFLDRHAFHQSGHPAGNGKKLAARDRFIERLAAQSG